MPFEAPATNPKLIQESNPPSSGPRQGGLAGTPPHVCPFRSLPLSTESLVRFFDCQRGGLSVKENILVTGGAGFIGSNLVHNLLGAGHHVTVFDALLRRGTEHNLAWLRAQHPHRRLRFLQGDVRDFSAVQAATADADVIFHLAGQVACTS